MRRILPGGRAAQRPGALVLFALILGMAAPAKAEEGVFSYYMGLRAIGTQSKIDNVQGSSFNGAAVIQNDTDVVGGVGLVFGAKSKKLPMRLELEVAQRFRFDLDVRENQTGNVIDHEMNVSTTSALISAILEWRNPSSFTPFVGASIGWARNSVTTERVNFATAAKTTRDNATDNFAWGGTVGVDWFFAQNWSAQAAYRYIDLGETDSGPGPAGESIKGGSYTSHDLLLGVFYHF
jgi:opacity protein-like surface antigen